MRYYLHDAYNSVADIIGLDDNARKSGLADWSGLPVIGSILRAEEQGMYMDDYMRNTGLSWSDVKYPTLTRGAGSNVSAVIGGFNYISKNVSRLYS